MKSYFSQNLEITPLTEEDFTPVSLMDSIEKTRRALDNAYAGFNNALESNLIDSYIYEINALQKRYDHLCSLALMETMPSAQNSHQHTPIGTLFRHVFG